MWLKHAHENKFSPYEVDTGDILTQYETEDKPKPSHLLGVYFYEGDYIKALFWLKCVFCGRKKTLAKNTSTAICLHCISKGRGKKRLRQSEQDAINKTETLFKNQTQTKETIK